MEKKGGLTGKQGRRGKTLHGGSTNKSIQVKRTQPLRNQRNLMSSSGRAKINSHLSETTKLSAVNSRLQREYPHLGKISNVNYRTASRIANNIQSQIPNIKNMISPGMDLEQFRDIILNSAYQPQNDELFWQITIPVCSGGGYAGGSGGLAGGHEGGHSGAMKCLMIAVVLIILI